MSTHSRREQAPRETHFMIRYCTRYAYDADVVDNLNALRVRPAMNNRQTLDEFSVRMTPEARLRSHADYFGTEVIEFEIARPHRELVVDARARVATRAPAAPPEPDWKAVDTTAYREAGGEFLLQIDNPHEHPVLQELLAETSGLPDPLALVLAVCELIRRRFEYRRGATYVDSPISAVLDGGAGVCQDFVHLALCVLRHHGIAARYVSGYLFTTRSEQESESAEVDTHAWLEALLPSDDEQAPEPVWVSVDPTNGGLTTERHVKIGHGRHYADVPPIKGVYRGMANAELEARITMTRIEGSDPGVVPRS